VTGTLSPAVATRLEKVAVDNGFDFELPRDGAWLGFASTQAPLRIWLTAPNDLLCVAALSMAQVATGLEDLGRPFSPPLPSGATAARVVTSFAELHQLVRRAFQLSRTLPDALLREFERRTTRLPRATEIERVVVQRVGQEVFREGLLEYWQGRCAVSGLAVPELLRASHIKPWAACESDAERLDVFNGLLLAPHLDAAFDQGFITVTDTGAVVVSTHLDEVGRRAMGVNAPLRIDGLQREHRAYLSFHRSRVFRDGVGVCSASVEIRDVRPLLAAHATRRFDRYIGIDYSGAETPLAGLPGLRVFVATPETAPAEERLVRGHWSRRRLGEWLVGQLSNGPATIVGIDHAFSFPLEYFDAHHLPKNWDSFLEDFHRHWPTDSDTVWVRDLRNEPGATASARRGKTTWRRLTERRAGAAKSVFHFGVQGEVATSTHAGLPWLGRIRAQLDSRVHMWPFDGWGVPQGMSVIAEVYPSLWRRSYPVTGINEHQRDAYVIAAWLRDTDRDGRLISEFEPPLTVLEQEQAAVEGWILGVGGEEGD
jgi:putative restriction endonuclease